MNNFSDPHPLIFSCSTEFRESSSACEGTASSRPANFSDEEVMLASSHPKKRAGRKKFLETRQPVYGGVRRRNSGEWVCEVREPNKKSRIWRGTFLTPEMAARAHDVATIALRGRSACLNFADSLWRLPIPASPEAKDIQKATAEAFRPPPDNGGCGGDVVANRTAALPKNAFYMDDEALFGMPELLTSMAEGMMLPAAAPNVWEMSIMMEMTWNLVLTCHCGVVQFDKLTCLCGVFNLMCKTSRIL